MAKSPVQHSDHAIENTDDKPFESILVEMKCKPAAAKAATALLANWGFRRYWIVNLYCGVDGLLRVALPFSTRGRPLELSRLLSRLRLRHPARDRVHPARIAELGPVSAAD